AGGEVHGERALRVIEEDLVGPGPAVDVILAVGPPSVQEVAETVVAAVADERVVAAAPLQLLAARAAGDDVVEVVADQEMVDRVGAEHGEVLDTVTVGHRPGVIGKYRVDAAGIGG